MKKNNLSCQTFMGFFTSCYLRNLSAKNLSPALLCREKDCNLVSKVLLSSVCLSLVTAELKNTEKEEGTFGGSFRNVVAGRLLHHNILLLQCMCSTR